jgi:hypothetical protein
MNNYAKRGYYDAMVPFSELRYHLKSLEYRNDRLKLNRMSLHADLLANRSNGTSVSFQQLMQTDFILFIRDCLDYTRINREPRWFPVTLLFAERQYGPFEIFARSQSVKYFDKIKQIFDINTKDDLIPMYQPFKDGTLKRPWNINISKLMGFDKLASLP